jgi:hypothetical protein
MWIILNNSFLSIVENRNNKGELLVRSRVKGDIEKVISDAEVFEDSLADYKYRTFIKKEKVASIISNELLNINYDNFKNSVSKNDFERYKAYNNVWSAMRVLQK